ncbi:MAG: rod shape-determining protein MreC [Flavobacteriales bacterium]
MLLIIIGLMITIQQKRYQRTKFINSANLISGGTYSAISNIEAYFNLISVNDELHAENALLRSQALVSLKKINGEYFQVNDNLFKQRYVYRIASVVSNTTTKVNNFFTLDLGKEDGIIEEMGVISPMGIIGIVGAVSDHYSSVISFLHPKTYISCKLKSTGVAGILKWMGGDITIAEIRDIPITTQINNGDSVLTSGYSSVFPAGIYLGKIRSYEKDLENQSQKIIVDLKIDYSSVSKVYVVENLYKSEEEELRQKEIQLSE